MKSIYNIWVFIACLALASCYDEDSITPSAPGDTGRFEFPQGNNSWDDDIYDIYNEYGVRLIYKDILDQDFSKSWIGGNTGMITYHGAGCINDEMTQFYVKFMKEHVFHYLNPQITEKILPMYWYLAFNFHNVWTFPTMTLYNPMKSQGDLAMMDCWLTCFWGQNVGASQKDPLIAWMSPLTEDKTSYAIRRCFIINDVITAAIGKGNIVMPAEFDTGFDHSTRLVITEYDEDKLKPNYYLNRGYPGKINTANGNYTKPAAAPTAAAATFLGYVQLSIRFTKEEREEMFPASKYPFTKEKFDLVQKYMKEKYNLDLNAIAEGPASWNITPYPELPPAILP